MATNLWTFTSCRGGVALSIRCPRITSPAAWMLPRRNFACTAKAQQASDWSPAQYLKFENQRTIPVEDLLAKVPLASPKRVIDLGCGPGNSTAVLKEEFPDAEIIGMDSSEDMLDKARKTLPDISFVQSDLKTYESSEPADLLFSNAVFHWLPHDDRIPIMQRLLETQDRGGVLALQVPDNTNEPSHRLMRKTAKDGPWKATLEKDWPGLRSFPKPIELYNQLKPLCSKVDIWRTTYFHILKDHEAIVEWVKGTGLRPFLDPLPSEQQAEFLQKYLERLKEAYAPLEDGRVMLGYPRLFVVAVRA